MKKLTIVTAAIMILLSMQVFAQTDKPSKTGTTILNEALKHSSTATTGSLQDVLSNYLQVAAKNITTENSGLQLKLNWFELNTTPDQKKYSAAYLKDTWWQRNGEFVGAVSGTKDFKVNSYQLGLNYNLWNRRDADKANLSKVFLKPFAKETVIIDTARTRLSRQVVLQIRPTVANFINGFYVKGGSYNKTDFRSGLEATTPGFRSILPTDSGLKSRFEDLVQADFASGHGISSTVINFIDTYCSSIASEIIDPPINAYVRAFGNAKLDFSSQYISAAQTKEVVDFIDQAIANDTFFRDTLKVSNLAGLNNKVLNNYNELIRYIGRQPLITFGYLYTHGKGAALSSHVAGFNLVYGIGGWKDKNPGQLQASVTDTLTSNDPTGATRNYKRNILALKAGYNKVLVATSKEVSLLELSTSSEFDKALKGFISKTDKTLFYLDASIRGRLPTTPWLKLDLKWDPKNGNVFGLFDFTYNLDK